MHTFGTFEIKVVSDPLDAIEKAKVLLDCLPNTAASRELHTRISWLIGLLEKQQETSVDPSLEENEIRSLGAYRRRVAVLCGI